MTETTTPRAARPAVVTAIAVLAVLAALGAAAMTAFHVDLYRAGALPPFVPWGFAAGTLAFVVVAYGVWRRAAWAWPVAVVVNGLGFVSATFPWRGPQAAVPAAVTLVALALLLSRPGRQAAPVEGPARGGRVGYGRPSTTGVTR